VLNPVTNETYVQAAAGKKADIDRAVAAAKRAFDEGPWPRMLPRALARAAPIADIVESRDARSPSSSPSTRACRSPRRSARPAAPPRTSASSPT
jgi:5-carboxymethyl-2-hydroxymuconic-semialdehyde dehydrogenase